MRPGYGSLLATRITMPTLAENLSGQAGRTILDKTGLAGEYSIDLKWTPDERTTANDNGASGDTPPQLAQALRQQLGLKLTPSKADVPTLVVDAVHLPDAN